MPRQPPQQQELFAGLGFLVKLCVIEKLVAKHNLFDPPPDRKTLLAWIDEGILEGRKVGGNYYVVGDSFKALIRSFESERYHAPRVAAPRVSLRQAA